MFEAQENKTEAMEIIIEAMSEHKTSINQDNSISLLTTNYRQTQPIYVNFKPIQPSSISPEPQQSYSTQQQFFSPQQQQSNTSPNSLQPYMISNQQYPLSPLTHEQPTFNPRTSQYSNLSE